MFCSKCGEEVSEENLYCPVCGGSQEPEDKKPPRRTPFWFVCLFAVTLIGVAAGFYSAFTSLGGMGQAAQDQLVAIKTNQMTKAYYGYTSKDFQSSTSLDNFRRYVKAHPVLVQNADAVFHTRLVNDSNTLGTLEGVLVAKNGSTIPVKYQMVKEDSQWKVLNMELGKNDNARSEAVDSSELKKPIEEQLKALKEGDYKKAYEEYTSKDFKASTPFDRFEAFIKSYPILTNYQDLGLKEKEIINDHAQVIALFSNSDGAIPADYKLVKEDGRWKIWSLHLLLVPTGDQEQSNANSEDLVVPVTNQLNDLRSGDVKKAYEQVAKGFKVATSFDDFKEFVASFPALSDNQATIKEHFFDKGVGRVNVEIKSSYGNNVLEYTLTKEDGKWKVWGLRVADRPPFSDPLTESETADFDSSELLKPIEEQLTAIRDGDYKKAYESYTSTAFKQATTQEEFSAFLENYPVFKENLSSSFDALTFEGNVGIYTGLLTAKSGEKAPVEYDLVKEKGEWKVLSIKVLSTQSLASEPYDPSKPMTFTELLIGTEVDLSGKILDPGTTFSEKTKDIYATLVISNGKEGEKIEVIFEHVPTGSQIPPVAAALERDGSNILSFIFTPPVSGWPAGDYVIKVSSANGEKKSYPFTLAD